MINMKKRSCAVSTGALFRKVNIVNTNMAVKTMQYFNCRKDEKDS